jgi:hypothetical protein
LHCAPQYGILALPARLPILLGTAGKFLHSPPMVESSGAVLKTAPFFVHRPVAGRGDAALPQNDGRHRRGHGARCRFAGVARD